VGRVLDADQLQQVVDAVVPVVYAEIASSEDRLATAIAGATKSVLDRTRRQVPTIQFGTVVDTAGPLVNLTLDVDPAEVVQSYAATTDITAGDRVALMHTPPDQAIVLGRIVDLGVSGFIPRFDIPDAGVTRMRMTDQTVVADAHITAKILDQRSWSGSPSSASAPDGAAILNLVFQPTLAPGTQIDRYDGLQIRSADFMPDGEWYPADATIEELNAVGLHWNAPIGTTIPILRGFFGHLGANVALIEDARPFESQSVVLFGGEILKATGHWFSESHARRTWGFRLGGILGDVTDYWPSYHAGPIAMGGPLQADGDGGQFDPQAFLHLAEVRKLVRQVSVTTTAGSPVITTDVRVPPGLFDFPFDIGASVTGTGIPAGTIQNVFIPWDTHTMTLNQDATASGTVTATITKALADQNASGLILTPNYAGAATVTRHNYVQMDSPAFSGGANVTDACVIRFTAAPGVHKALAANGTAATTLGSTGPVAGTAGAPKGWMKMNVSGAIRYVPFW
jgi:hypothetical protein